MPCSQASKLVFCKNHDRRYAPGLINCQVSELYFLLLWGNTGHPKVSKYNRLILKIYQKSPKPLNDFF